MCGKKMQTKSASSEEYNQTDCQNYLCEWTMEGSLPRRGRIAMLIHGFTSIDIHVKDLQRLSVGDKDEGALDGASNSPALV